MGPDSGRAAGVPPPPPPPPPAPRVRVRGPVPAALHPSHRPFIRVTGPSSESPALHPRHQPFIRVTGPSSESPALHPRHRPFIRVAGPSSASPVLYPSHWPFIRVTGPSSESPGLLEPSDLQPGSERRSPGHPWLVARHGPGLCYKRARLRPPTRLQAPMAVCPSQAKPVPATNEPAAGQGCFRPCVDAADSPTRRAVGGRLRLGSARRPGPRGAGRAERRRVGLRGGQPPGDSVPAGRRGPRGVGQWKGTDAIENLQAVVERYGRQENLQLKNLQGINAG